MEHKTIQYTDEMYDALKTIHYALKNDREGLMPIPGMEAMHYKIACESLEEALKTQGISLPG